MTDQTTEAAQPEPAAEYTPDWPAIVNRLSAELEEEREARKAWRQRAETAEAGLPAGRAAGPAAWIDGHPHLEAIAATVWGQCRTEDGLVVDDPRTIAVAALAAVVAVLPPPADQAAEIERMRERHAASLRRADEINGALMEEVQRYAEGKEQPVLWSVYNEMHKRALNAEATVARVRRLHDALDEETALTSPDDEITRGSAARRLAAALDGWTSPAELRRMADETPAAACSCGVLRAGPGRHLPECPNRPAAERQDGAPS